MESASCATEDGKQQCLGADASCVVWLDGYVVQVRTPFGHHMQFQDHASLHFSTLDYSSHEVVRSIERNPEITETVRFNAGCFHVAAKSTMLNLNNLAVHHFRQEGALPIFHRIGSADLSFATLAEPIKVEPSFSCTESNHYMLQGVFPRTRGTSTFKTYKRSTSPRSCKATLV